MPSLCAPTRRHDRHASRWQPPKDALRAASRGLRVPRVSEVGSSTRRTYAAGRRLRARHHHDGRPRFPPRPVAAGWRCARSALGAAVAPARAAAVAVGAAPVSGAHGHSTPSGQRRSRGGLPCPHTADPHTQGRCALRWRRRAGRIGTSSSSGSLRTQSPSRHRRHRSRQEASTGPCFSSFVE